MNSRDAILKAVSEAQPAKLPLPQLNIQPEPRNAIRQFTEVLRTIGGAVIEVENRESGMALLQKQFAGAQWIQQASELAPDSDPHSLEKVDLAIVDAAIGVAENGAIWITDAVLPQRVLPFIAQHLAVFLPKDKIVPNMHEAYSVIGSADYGFGVFIAGPSKTADIEQSLVLGAHGARTMQVVLF